MDRLLGKVIKKPTCHNETSSYVVIIEDKEYRVVSKNYQSVKDHIFINEGQTVEIIGDIVDNTIYVKESKILLKSRKERKKIWILQAD